jgi:processive 1,2-diacylglycerol beta-glucosyltransferase
LFGAAYQFEEKHSMRPIYEGMSLGAEKFYQDYQREQYDLVLTTHVFAAMIVCEAKRRHGLSLPLHHITTDYTCHPGANLLNADVYYLPHEFLATEFIAEEIPEERLVDAGIPVRPEFYQTIDRAKVREEMNLPQEGRILLLCCGSIGCGKLDKVVPTFAAELPEDVHLVVVCGNNQKLYEKLCKTTGENTTVISYTKEMEKLTAVCDFCIGKPGGLSVTEFLVQKVPSVLVLAVPGCETHNWNFMKSHGLAKGAETWEEALLITLCLLKEPEAVKHMRERLENFPVKNAAEVIAEAVMNAGEIGSGVR